MSSWAATLRIARRDALRARGRSALVVAMIALPVMGVTAIDVVARTFELSPDQQITRELGQADAVFSDSGRSTVRQLSRNVTEDPGDPRPDGELADVPAVLPPGSRVLTDQSTSGSVGVADRTTTVQLRELDYADPLADGLYVQRSGRVPADADEAVLTTALADRLGVAVGDEVRLTGADRSVRVVGLVDSQTSHEIRAVLLQPGALDPSVFEGPPSYLVDVPGQLVWADVEVANAEGVFVRTRGHVPGEPPEQGNDGGVGEREIATIVLIVGMVLLEVVLLAGPAFAVGAKRSAHSLALLAATGAERRHVRRTILCGGLVLGAVGGLIGVAAGLGLAVVAVPQLSRLDGSVPGPFDVRVLELLAIAVVGVGTAVLAALLPARAAARQSVVAALTGRRGTARSSRRTPVLGLLAAVAGAAIALYGARERDITVILAGSVIAELGLVATTPFLVGLTGRLGARLPVAPRLALRDAARNRGRTAPAVAAILAAVAGSVAVGTVVASTDGYDRARYEPRALDGTAVLGVYDAGQRERIGELRAALEQTLPARQVVTVQALDNVGTTPVGYAELAVPPEQECPTSSLPPDAAPAQLDAAVSDPRCRETTFFGGYLSQNLVGGADVLAAVTGVEDPALRQVLVEGGIVVPHPRFVDDTGHATVMVHPPSDVDGTQGRPVLLPAAALPAGVPATTLYSPEAAAQVGLPVDDAGLVALLDRLPAGEEEDAAQGALERLGVENDLYVERGYVSDYGVGLLALALGSAVLVLGASGIATGLAAADGRADLATLAAVGATPSMRRVLAAFQSAVTAGLGTALGVVAGLIPAIGLLRALNSTANRPPGFVQTDLYPIVLPWETLLVTALVVPLLAALAAAMLTRSRLPLVRRLA